MVRCIGVERDVYERNEVGTFDFVLYIEVLVKVRGFSESSGFVISEFYWIAQTVR